MARWQYNFNSGILASAKTRMTLGRLPTYKNAASPFLHYMISIWDNSLTKQYTTYSKQIAGKMLSVEDSGAEQLSGIIQL